MNIALMAHDNKKELMVQFCTAYAGILSRHTLCATSVTGKMVSEASGLPIHLFMARIHGGAEQIGARISYNEIDMVLFFCDPANPQYNDSLTYITRTTFPSPPISPPPKCSSWALPAATSTGAISSTRRRSLSPPERKIRQASIRLVIFNF
jgi:hypothetical protein